MVFSFHKDRSKVGVHHDGLSIAFFILLAILGVILLIAYFSAPHAKATGTPVAITGYAWGAEGPDSNSPQTAGGVGWLHFNGTSYGVTMDPSTGNLGGYAWSDNVGWVAFGDDSANGVTVSSGCPLSPCQANVNTATGKVMGWIRATTGIGRTDGWDGWIHLSEDGSGYASPNTGGGGGVTYAAGKLVGYAWGGMDQMGWIKFDGAAHSVGVANPITASCTPSAGPYDTAHTVAWTVDPQSIVGAVGTPTYSWSGTEVPNNSTGNPLSILYTSGVKNAPSASITDANGNSGTVNCTNVSGGPTITVAAAPISGSCSASPNSTSAPVAKKDQVTWTAYPVGGTGTYTSYAWTISPDGPSGSGISRTKSPYYSAAGAEASSVVVTDSDGHTATLSCAVTVKQAFTGTCSVSPNIPYTGVPMTWTAHVTDNAGGGATSYSWGGTTPISSGATVSGTDISSAPVTYPTKGNKSAVLTIVSGGPTGQTSTITCSPVNVQDNPNSKEF